MRAFSTPTGPGAKIYSPTGCQNTARDGETAAVKFNLKFLIFRFLITRPLVGGEAQLGRQEPAEGKLRCCLSLLDLYFDADQSAGSKTQHTACLVTKMDRRTVRIVQSPAAHWK